MKRLSEVFRKYDSLFTAVINTRSEALKALENSDFREGSKTWEEKYEAAQNIYNEKMAELKETGLAEVKTIFEEVNKKVDAFVMEPVPADFLSTLEGIKVLDNITEHEAKALFEKYKGNYLAARALSEYLHKEKGYFTVKMPPLDEIKKDLEIDYEQARQFFVEYKTDEYRTKLFIVKNENPWDKEAEKVEAFLGGNVLAIVEE